MATTTVDLYLLGHGSDPAPEHGTACPGALPPASDPTLVERVRAAKAALGDRVYVLGHHYQRDEVIQFADVTGDSFRLAQQAAANPGAEYVVFCGVHFMAESADILTANTQHVVLPDLAAGCSMADMADFDQVEDAWDALTDAGAAGSTVPVTYMNSTAAIKAFTGRHGGTVCTSSNARRAIEWALSRGDRGSVDEVRERIPGVRVLVHPECRHDVAMAADLVGSTEFIIRTVAESPAGSSWAIGTELNLVSRLAQRHPDKTIVFLDRTVCYCATMNRIDLPHLATSLEALQQGRLVHEIAVDPRVAADARVALDRMLALP